ncbi:MAG: amino acid adenylation domain-containing protein, partial [Acidobacteriota bacterium]
MIGLFEYNRDLFDDSTISRMAGHFENLLMNILSLPQQHISTLPLLSAAEQEQLLVTWNNTKFDYSKVNSIQKLFELQVERTPDAIALVWQEQQLSYRELNIRINQLAHHLRGIDTVTNSIIGVFMQRCLELPIAVLAIMKAGATYLPLDPAYPKERLAFMLADANVAVIITKAEFLEQLPNTAISLICLDRDSHEIAGQCRENSYSRVEMDDLAYVIYTSGSTGQAKGVMITQAAIVNRLLWGQQAHPLSQQDRLLQLTSISFDVSLWELFTPLLFGAQLVIAPAEASQDPVYLNRIIIERRITLVAFVPTLLQLFLSTERVEACKDLRLVFCGGEALMPELQERCLARLKAELFNFYGPTETTIDATYWQCQAGNVARTVPIGRPIGNFQAYVLDSYLQPVAIGVAGELYLGGNGLARGYLNRPELTAERFIPHPFSDQPGARLYRTGDLVRYLPDSNIEFLGRCDSQVKVRGLRIELGEIEATLVGYPDVEDAVVIAQGKDSKRELIAYIVLKPDVATTTRELRNFLKAKLPWYMLPSAIVTLPVLPLLPNGKVDRRALPAHDFISSDNTGSASRAYTPIEEIVAGIWAEVLAIKNPDPHNSFFELGGHSLSATQVISRIRQAFKIELPVRSLFELPTIASLAETIANILWSEQGLQHNLQILPITPIPRTGALPLSFAQQRLWFLDQLEPANPFYNLPAAIYLNGELNISAFEQSINRIIARHESLRTSIATIDGQPLQIIAESAAIPLPVVDLRQLTESICKTEAVRLANEQAILPFDLAHSPLLRIILIRLEEYQYVFLFVMHHIISDGWSIGLLIHETAICYQAFISGQPATLSALPIQYADFAHWQREWLQGAELATQLVYWRRHLQTTPPILELPTDRPRPSVQTFQGTRIPLRLCENLFDELRILCQRQGVTLFMVLTAAFKTLLYRYTRQEQIVIGSPIANRNRAEIEGLIGFFVNTLVLNTDLSGSPTFIELLERVKEAALGAYTHQDLPFEKLVEELQPIRDLSHTPLFQVMFVLQNAPMAELKLAGLSINRFELDCSIAKFDLTLEIEDSGNELLGYFEYNINIFDAVTISRMVEHWQILLDNIVVDPYKRIVDLSLLTTAERHQLLTVWNNTGRHYAQDSCIHKLFEAQVEQTPNAIALVFEDRQLTYQELNIRANQLAHYLQKSGIGCEALVAICLERSLEMIISILAILKAGAAYLPLDPNYPSERLHFIMDDADITLLLTEASLIKTIPTQHQQVICLDTDWQTIACQREDDLPDIATVTNTAYVIYTSGSTGKPKGVLISHYNIGRLFHATEQWFQFNQHDTWTLFHSYAFDFSVWEIWGALLHGGRLVIVHYLVSRSPEEFYRLLCREQVTVLNQTPSAFRQLIRIEDSINNSDELALRLVIFGGEALELQSLRPWFNRHGDQHPRLVNMYGITETTVHVTYRPLTIADLDLVSKSVIGGPIPDLQVYILDQYQQLLPIGVVGEMYIGGDGLARGYLNRAELMAARFVPNPFSSEAGARLYRSGDLARYLANGDIEYLGRIDNQVKIRGFRIELGEIEAALGEHPDVLETVVVTRAEKNDEARLVAYWVSVEGKVGVNGLREFLRQKLPEYMVPAIFVLLNKLPLTTNGKIDYNALPTPEPARPELEKAFTAPSTVTEEVLAEVWAQVLGLEKVGIDNNFFALGGDSIRSIQILSRARKWGLNISLQQLFQYQTIRELAREVKLTDVVAHVPGQPFCLISQADCSRLPEDIEDAYPLSKLQAGFVYHSEYSSDYLIYISSFHLRAPLDIDKLRMALQQLTIRHTMLRTSFDLASFNEPLQLVYKTVSIPITLEDLRHLSNAEQEEWLAVWMKAEMSNRFDWSRPPLLRFYVHRRSDETFQLTFSEPFFDGWSVAIILTELFEQYFLLLNGTAPPIMTPLAASYRDFVALEQAALVSAECRDYWTEKLSNCSATRLPHWQPAAEIADVLEVRRIDVPICDELSQALKSLAWSAGVSIKSVMLTAHLKVVSIFSGQTDVMTGVLFNGRPEEIDGESIVGAFLNTLPFRLQLPDSTWIELIQKTFEAERELLPYRRYPFAELQRAQGRQPLFDTIFNFTHFHVYQRVQGLYGMEVLGDDGTEQTYYALTTQFNLDTITSQLRLALDYRTIDLCPEQVENIAGYYTKVLSLMADEPAARHQSLCLLSTQEQLQLLVEWNKTAIDYPVDLTIYDLFEIQVERTPYAIALVYEDKRLTYIELSQRTNQLAHYLRSLGAGLEVPVGICLNRSIEMIVAILGILKAGATYLPLDPDYPQHRREFMIADSGLKFLLTEDALLNRFYQSQLDVICLDLHQDKIAKQSTQRLSTSIYPNNLAYIIYTSGSTGVPKGVAIEHRSVVAFLHWAIDQFSPQELTGVLASTSICFDLSVFELFATLSSGGKVILTENILHLPELSCAEEVTLINTVPSAITELIRMDGIPTSVQTINLAGEPLKSSLTEQIYQYVQVAAIYN